MQRHEFEHVIAASADVSGEVEIVVVGSQAILGSFPTAPAALLRSIEADVYPRFSPEKADLIDGSLGDGSDFHRANGYYAHGVGPETAKAPKGWEQRLIKVDIPKRVASNQRAVARCMEVHDLVLAKCAAGRERDWEFAREALRAGVVDAATLDDRIDDLPIDVDQREAIRRTLGAIAKNEKT